MVNIPAGFTRQLLRRERPALLIEADATDPIAAANASGGLERHYPVGDSERADRAAGVRWREHPRRSTCAVHRLFNPDGITQYNVVPGLMGVILTLTMVMMTGLAITRERERGTMENLLAMPSTPIEVMTGKLIPYIGIGLIQSTHHSPGGALCVSCSLFRQPGRRLSCALLFVAANLTVGITFSSLAKNQLQAVQLTIFYFLPNILLSGFMFPFQGMPQWAQVLGDLLPLTYFNRLIRGIMLKGNGWANSWPSVWPMIVFTLVVMALR